MSIRPAAALLVLLSLVACASGGSSRSPLLSPGWSPPSGYRCSVDDDPLPVVTAVADTAALHRALGGETALGRAAGSYLVGAVTFDSLGAVDSVRVAESHLLDAADVDRGLAILREHARPQPRGRTFSVLLRTSLLPSARSEVGPTEGCPPFLSNQRQVTERLALEYEEVLRFGPIMTDVDRVVILQLKVDSTGAVTDASAVRLSGRRDVNEAALRMARVFRFAPALYNRRPVPITIQMPVTFKARERPLDVTAPR